MRLSGLGARVVRVEDLSDPRLDDYRAIRDGDQKRRSRFIAESAVVLRVLIERARHPVRSALVIDSKLEKLADLLERLPAEAPVFVASQSMMDDITGFHIHRGVLASVERAPVPTAAAWLAALPAGAATVVVLEELSNHDNVGGVFRNAAAFDASGVLIDERTCDPLYRKAIRVSVGGALFVPYARAPDSETLMQMLREAGFYSLALTPSRDAREIADFARSVDRPARVALWLGSEGPGLRPATLAAADERVRIDIADGFDSLNVATTSGVALYALRQR